MRTAIQYSGFGTQSVDTTQQNLWLDAAYTWVWNAFDWTFKQVSMESLTVTASDSTPTMPGGIGEIQELIDNQGMTLERLDEDTFNSIYQYGVVNSQTGRPIHYKFVNRVLTLGPTPSAAATFYISYERRLSHFQSDGTTVVAGSFDADTDIPIFPAEHHMILVYHACMVGHGILSNPAAVNFKSLRDDALTAMIEDLADSVGRGSQYGRELV